MLEMALRLVFEHAAEGSAVLGAGEGSAVLGADDKGAEVEGTDVTGGAGEGVDGGTLVEVVHATSRTP